MLEKCDHCGQLRELYYCVAAFDDDGVDEEELALCDPCDHSLELWKAENRRIRLTTEAEGLKGA